MVCMANGNASEARRLYIDKYPNRRAPDPRTFSRVHHRLRETGSVFSVNAGGRTRQLDPIGEENVLQTVEEDPSTSTRNLASTFFLHFTDYHGPLLVHI